jgi:integrase
MTQAKEGWSYSAGEWGRNRVRAFEHPKTGRIFLEFADNGKRKRVALGHRDREAAKAKAEEVALALRRAEPRRVAAPTLQMLFDNYVREVTPQKGLSTQRHDRRAAELFLRFFGPEQKAAALSRRDWDAFIVWRRQGGDQRGGHVRGQSVGNRVITYDLKWLRSVYNWAMTAGDGQGRTLLDRNPLQGLAFPKEENPRRPILNDKQYKALLAASRQIDAAFELALVLANETGHRIGAIRLLRWSDVDVEGETIRWRAGHDKIGFEHRTPLSADALAALQRRRKAQPSIGDAWIFPAPGGSSEPCSRHLLRDWWQRGEALAKTPHEAGLGWHSLRRKFATELKQVPLKDLCYLGGWKEPQTILKCYQRPDAVTMREALASRRHLQAV